MRPDRLRDHPRLVMAVSCAAAGIILVADAQTPRGVIEWVFYLIPVALVSMTMSRRTALAFAGGCSVLLGVGFVLSPPGLDPELAAANRVAAVVLLGAVTVGLTRMADLIERVRVEETRLRLAVENADTGLWDWDLATQEVYLSPIWKRQLGYEDHELPNRYETWKDRIHPDDRQAAEDRLLAARDRAAGDFSLEFRLQHRNGTYRWILSRATVLRDADGRATRLIGSHVDLTDQRERERALSERDRLLREVGAMAKVGGWEFDVATGAGAWTDEVARIHDLDPSLPTTREIGLGFYVGESRQRIETALQAATTDGTPYDLELEMITAAGRRKWVRTIARPIRDENRVVRIRGSFQDITDHESRRTPCGARAKICRPWSGGCRPFASLNACASRVNCTTCSARP